MKPLPEHLSQTALELYDCGLTTIEISRRIGVANQTVRRWVIPGERERHNATRKRHYRKVERASMRGWFDYRAEQAAKLRKAGLTWKALSEHFGVSIQIVKVWLDATPKKQEKRRRNHCGSRKSQQRNDADHNERIRAHQARVRRGE